MSIFQETFTYNNQEVTLETGKLARQCCSLTVRSNNTVILVTVVASSEAAPDQSFFPLSVDYREKYYAVGKIPGGFLKREGRPSEKEILTSRLIDRAIRPLFPDGFMNEVQVICSVLSSHKEEDADILSMIGASAALAISNVPFDGPIGAAKVAYYIGQEYVINPKRSQMDSSLLDMTVAGTENAVMMVESGANELNETVMLGAIECAHSAMQQPIEAIKRLAEKIAPTKMAFEAHQIPKPVIDLIEQNFTNHIKAAFQVSQKCERQQALSNLKKNVLEFFEQQHADSYTPEDIKTGLSQIQKTTLRQSVLSGNPRIDGRDTTQVRPIATEVGPLPSAHGSALFTRGETQSLSVTTLAPLSSGQLIDDLDDARRDPFMLHYNFPGFCVGEISRAMGPKRREIGHGKLARRAIEPMLPNDEQFPYSIRLVSEILESNGSSSMATVCAGSMALMNAGVPIKGPVSGIAMGLIKEADNVKVLTDILGDEDHLGDMDFKVAGSSLGITALQMDIKIKGISIEIMKQALTQAKEARLHILEQMAKTIEVPQSQVAKNAPQVVQFQINSSKISAVIGKGGANIKKVIEENEVEVDVEQDGSVKIYGANFDQVKQAEKTIRSYVFEPTVGEIYEGKVKNITTFGAFVEIAPNCEGLVHVSEIADERVENVNDYIKSGETVDVKLISIDDKGRLKLSIKQANSIEISDDQL